MFYGVNILNLDAKWRLAIPGRHREALVEGCDGRLVITVSKEPCLWVYPLNEWKRVAQAVKNLPELNPVHKELQQILLGLATDVDMDKNGRVLIPDALRKFANITEVPKEVYLLGLHHKFELWEGELWTAKCEQWRSKGFDTENITAEMEQLSL